MTSELAATEKTNITLTKYLEERSTQLKTYLENSDAAQMFYTETFINSIERMLMLIRVSKPEAWGWLDIQGKYLSQNRIWSSNIKDPGSVPIVTSWESDTRIKT